MEFDARHFVHWFRQAGPYIQGHRGRTFVVAIDDDAVDSPVFHSLIQDVTLLHTLGIRLVVVHGARRRIGRRLAAAGLESRFHNGVRVTTDQALPHVMDAAASVHMDIKAQLSMGLANTPLSGTGIRVVSGNFVTARPFGVHDGVDFCFTGRVRRVDTEGLRTQLDAEGVVLVSHLGFSPTGEVFNLAAEEVATAVASGLEADKLIFLTRGMDGVPAELSPVDARSHADDAMLGEEARRHLASAADATRAGVGRVHLVRWDRDGSLLLELYTRDGSGTLVTGERFDTLRPADIDDVGGILELIAPLESAGALVRRSREQLELEIGRFRVMERDGAIVACAALFPFADEGVGEMAALAVHPDYRGGGRGERLLARIEEDARAAGLDRLFVLTTQAEHWFIEHGFVPGEVAQLPVARQSLYNLQRNSKVFIKALSA